MQKYSSDSLTNIKSVIQEKTDVSFTGTPRRYAMKKYPVLIACMLCFISLSAFAYYKFNSLNGDDLALSSVYLGDGKYEVIVTNMSSHDLKLQDNVKVMQWSTGSEVSGKNGSVNVITCDIPAGETGIIKIDISEAYDVEKLSEGLEVNDWYYFVLTNNNFAFGQDWMCSFDFDIKNPEEVIASHDSFVEYMNENTPFVPTYDEGMLIYDDWTYPVKDMRVSCYFGKQNNGSISDHINIAGVEGDEIYAVCDGTVIDVGFDSTYGNYVVLAVDNNITITYGHLKEVNVSKDAIVSQNDIIGLMGKTGRATGVNLSFALSVDGEYINPLK